MATAYVCLAVSFGVVLTVTQCGKIHLALHDGTVADDEVPVEMTVAAPVQNAEDDTHRVAVGDEDDLAVGRGINGEKTACSCRDVGQGLPAAPAHVGDVDPGWGRLGGELLGQLALHASQRLLAQPCVGCHGHPEGSRDGFGGLHGTQLVRRDHGSTRCDEFDHPAGRLLGLGTSQIGEGHVHGLALQPMLQVPGRLAVADEDDVCHAPSVAPRGQGTECDRNSATCTK